MASNTPGDTPNGIEPLTGEPVPSSLTDAGKDFRAETSGGESSAMFASTRQAFKDEAGKLTGQGLDKAKAYASDGKDRAGGALEEFAKLLTDAAGSVDEKMGEQYGDYARSAANSLAGFGENLRSKDIDDLLADAKEMVKKSPAVAIGTAAAVGFVLARLVKSGLDANDNNKA